MKTKYPVGKKYKKKYKKRKFARTLIGFKADKAYRMALRLTKEQPKIETKFIGKTINETDIDWNGVTAIFNNVSQGTVDTSRIGDSLRMIGLYINMTFSYVDDIDYTVSNYFNEPVLIRFIIIYDKQNKITTAAEYLQQSASNLAVRSSKNHDRRFETRLILDKTFNLNALSRPMAHLNEYIKLKLYTQFNGGTPTINTGALRYFIISDQDPTLSDTFCQALGRLKIHFTDC